MKTVLYEPALGRIPAFLWQRAAEAPHRLLMVDYDGTLAPLRTDRLEAVPLDLSIALLRRIAAGERSTVAILSGRPIRELERFTNHMGVLLIGENGWEERPPGGELIRHPLKEEHERCLRAAATAAAARPWGWRLERKRASIILHTRGMPAAEAEEVQGACEAIWRAEASQELELQRINGGVELRFPGRNKGTAARELLGRMPAETFPVHIGDDVGDEDAFREILTRGCGIRIGDASVVSCAQGRLASWIDLPFLLRRWLAIVEHEGDGGEGF